MMGLDGKAPDGAEALVWLLQAERPDSPLEVARAAAFMRPLVEQGLTPSALDQAASRALGFQPAAGPVALPRATGDNLSPLLGGASQAGTQKLLAEIRSALPRTDCGAPLVAWRADGQLMVSLFQPLGSDSNAQVAAMSPWLRSQRAGVKVVEVDGSKCGLLNLLASKNLGISELSVTLRDADGAERSHYRDEEFLNLEVAAGNQGGLLAVDFFMADGNVLHLVPEPTQPLVMLPAGERRQFGETRQGGQRWQIGPPFGNDLLVLWLTEQPLFETQRPQVERTADYVKALSDRLAHPNARAAVRVQLLVVQTAARE